MIDRRNFFGRAALGGVALGLPGCAETVAGSRRLSSASCPVPVDVIDNRVIRTVAGLRPYRRSGFVVRAEALGDKRLVHNYGHGGSGITLAWGTARLAIGLGLPGHAGPVAIIGSGIVGLTTARLVQEAGYDVTIYAKALPPETTSNIAGGQWLISSLYDDDAATPAFLAQLAQAQDYSWRRAQLMTGNDYGIRWLTTYVERAGPPGSVSPCMPGAEWLSAARSPFAGDAMLRFETLYAETGRLLRQLMRDVQGAGGRIVVRESRNPADIAALSEGVMFNCTGLGAKALFGDEELEPVRGQLAILLPQPSIDYAVIGGGGYMFPRAASCWAARSNTASTTLSRSQPRSPRSWPGSGGSSRPCAALDNGGRGAI